MQWTGGTGVKAVVGVCSTAEILQPDGLSTVSRSAKQSRSKEIKSP